MNRPVLTAPAPHGSPSVIGASRVRLLPAHSIVHANVRVGIVSTSSSDSDSGRSTNPSTRNRHASRSTGGTARLLRT